MKKIELRERGMWWLVTYGAFWCGVGLSFGCGTASEERRGQPPNPKMNLEHRGSEQCIGRFQFVLPEAMVVTSRSQSIYDVDVATVPLPTGGIKALWDSRLARILSLPPPKGVAQVLVRTFDVEPGVQGAWYFGNPDAPTLRDLEAAKVVGDHAVLITTGCEAGKESLIERLVKNVIAAYVPQTRQGFCVGYGSVTSEPSIDERTRMGLANREMKDLKIRFETQTVQESDTQTYSDLDEEREVVAGQRGNISVLRDDSRSADGLGGKEIGISVTIPGEPSFVRLTWHFPGVPGDSSQPMINIVGMAPSNQQVELQTVWDSLLQSLHRLPPSTGQTR
jgi:hypothetical protein